MPDINMQVFEEAKRNQLVTEIDIQTQVALDDYQVQLSDIANPIQSQDNVVIDRFGEFLPHWNESLDFDTWVKMSMEVAGKRLLMLRGNSGLSSTSNGNDTFKFFDDAESGTITDKWQSAAGSPTFVYSTDYAKSGTKSIKVSAGSNAVIVAKSIDEGDAIFEADAMTTGANGQYTYLSGRQQVSDNSYFIRPNVLNIFELRESVNGSHSSLDTGASGDISSWHVWGISTIGTTIKGFFDYNERTSASDSTLSSGSVGIRATASAVLYADNVRVRKYTAIEPTWTVGGVEQNIAVALKSLGRAG